MAQVTITLNGRAYRLSCGPGEEARLNELARDLNLRLERLAMDFGQHGSERLLVMASLLLTDELLELKARLGTSEGEIDSDEDERPGKVTPATVAHVSAPTETSASAETKAEIVAAEEPVTAAADDNATAAPRANTQRASLEARLAEARAGRSSAASPKSGVA